MSTNGAWQHKGAVPIKEAAEVLGLSLKTLYRRVEEKKIGAIQFGTGRLIMIPTNELKRLLNPQKS
jgi:excisionase family DNA binding protein